METEKNDKTLAVVSYILALDALRRASPVTQRLAAVCALETITLCTMLENITDLDAAKKLATDKHVCNHL